MSIAEQVSAAVTQLPLNEQQAVLAYAQKLQATSGSADGQPKRSLRGALAHLQLAITDDDVATARGEMWGRVERGAV